MIKELRSCIKKDLREYIRTGKWGVLVLTLAILSVMVAFTTLIVPVITDIMPFMTPDMELAFGYLEEVITELVPVDVRNNIGFWATDVGLFYTIVLAVVCSGLLPSEIKNGRWIMPLNCGYHKSSMILSKCIVYGIGGAVPIVVIQNLYFFIVRLALNDNYEFRDCLIGSVIYACTLGLVAVCTILVSVISKHGSLVCAAMIFLVITVPDIMSLLSIGDFLPTYLMTFAFNAGTNYQEVIVPMAITVVITVVLFIVASKKEIRYN